VQLLRLLVGEFAYHARMSLSTLLQHATGPNRVWTPVVWATLLCCHVLLVPTIAQAEEAIRGPDVVIIAGEDRVIYEFRQNGQLRMVRIVPKWGKPYYLVPRDNTKGFGDLERSDMLLPQWVIAEF
jgi:hypothetical protein